MSNLTKERLAEIQEIGSILRNRAADDPYIDDVDENGYIHINISDDCHFCSVPAFEGQEMHDTAKAIVGAGKAIADLLVEHSVSSAKLAGHAEVVADAKLLEDAAWCLLSLQDRNECYFDHHGGCQAHGYLSLKPGEKCPQQEITDLAAQLREWAAKLKQGTT